MTQTLSAFHPQYSEAKADWQLMRDAYKGERKVKKSGALYLPYTAGHILDGAGVVQESAGQKAYASYLLRARFPNFVREAVQMAIGMMHSQPPEIKLPKAMENIRSSKGESLPALLRRINTEQLITGRIGIMADLPSVSVIGKVVPYLTTYAAEKIINWDDGQVEEIVPQSLNLVVLDETEQVMGDGFNWSKKEKHRVLSMGSINKNESSGVYRQGVFTETEFSESALKTPSIMGMTLDQIPFVIVNSCDLISDVDDPALLDLGNLCMTIYRADADYRQNLYMQGQDTFVTSGAGLQEGDSIRTGAGARLDLPLGGKAEYVGVSGSGLEAQSKDLEKLESRAGSMGANTLDSTSRERESGDSMRIRVAARTADMNQIVETGATALENLLKICARWMGENEDEVSVNPNKEFGEMPLTGQTMVEMATARSLGFPLSAKSMHDLAFKRRMTNLTFEEEMEQAKSEDEENHPFKKPDNADRAGADQNDDGKDTDDDISARNKAKKKAKKKPESEA